MLRPSKKTIRLIASLIITFLLFYLSESGELEKISPGQIPVLYANQCDDDLEKLFVEAIASAQNSIELIIYSLSDKKVIDTLNRKSKEGVDVHVLYDKTTPDFGFKKLCSSISLEPIHKSGLMHQKILIVDGEKIWIGSANLTQDSLTVHDNLVVGLIDSDFAQAIYDEKPYTKFSLGGQKIEFWNLPKGGKSGLASLIERIDRATESIRVAMFTWTHPDLIEAILSAHHRDVKVEVILDRNQAMGVCLNTLKTLVNEGIAVRLSTGPGLLHHKFAWIDHKWLINGSANWTKAAFTRNKDCFLILHSLTEHQNEKMELLWKRTKILSEKVLPSEICTLKEAA